MANQFRMTLHTSVSILGLLLVFQAASPNAARGQETCYTAYSCGLGFETEFFHRQAGGNEWTPQPGWDGCDLCDIGGPVPFNFCAYPCFEGGEDQDSEQVAALREAVRQGDAKMVLALAPLFPKSIVFHRERQAIQIKTCDGSIIANLPVARDLALASMARQLIEGGSLTMAVEDR